MKKLVSIALCLCMIFAVACMTAGCGNDEVLKRIDDLQVTLQTQSGKIDELQNQNTNLTEKLEDVTTQNSQLSNKLDEMQKVIDGQTETIEELKSKTTQGVFYSVKEAYEKGYITLEDVKSIAYYHNGGREYNEQIMDEDYKPIPKSPEVLTENMQRPIKQTEWEYNYGSFRDDINPFKDTPSDFYIVEYNGIYNNCIAVMTAGCGGFGDESWKDEIEGIIISYADGNSIRIWKEI